MMCHQRLAIGSAKPNLCLSVDEAFCFMANPSVAT